MRCKGEACFVAVEGSFDFASASTRCQALYSGATLAFLTSIDERFLADSVLRMAGGGSGWVDATAPASSNSRSSFSWGSSSDTDFIAEASSWNTGEPNSGGSCASLNGRLQDQECTDTLPVALCRLPEGGVCELGRLLVARD